MKEVSVNLFGSRIKLRAYAPTPPSCGYCTDGLFQYIKQKHGVSYIFAARCNCDLGLNYKYNQVHNGELITIKPDYPMRDPTRSELYDYKNFPKSKDKEE